MNRLLVYHYAFIALLWAWPCLSIAQISSDSLAKEMRLLHGRGPESNKAFHKHLLHLKTLARSQELLQALMGKEDEGDSYFKAKLNCTRAILLYAGRYPQAGDSVKTFFKQAINNAYETADDNLIYYISQHYAGLMEVYGDIDLSAMYYLSAVELHDRLFPRDADFNYWQVSSILYHTREYERSIFYTRKAIANLNDSSTNYWLLTSCWNTIGLSWQKLGNYDSALANYNEAMHYAVKWPNVLWQGIISGNKGQTLFLMKRYGEARPLLEADYQTSKQQGYFDNAANSLQWIAQICLAEGKKDSALILVQEAIRLLGNTSSSNYRHNLYATAAEAFRVNNMNDSFYHYSQLYNSLHDSIETAIANSRIAISKTKLENEQNIFRIKRLQKEKDTEEEKRNFIVIAILLLAIIILFYLNRLRLKNQHKEQIALKEKEAAEARMAAAKNELEQFTRHLFEKTSLIETLQQQLQQKTQVREQQEMIGQLAGQTILTEEDWEKFKLLFEKIYPGFFALLRKQAPDITSAELRMAALVRLQLGNKQIASMLGISPDSVTKTRQRLRQRLSLGPDSNLDEYIAGLAS